MTFKENNFKIILCSIRYVFVNKLKKNSNSTKYVATQFRGGKKYDHAVYFPSFHEKKG